MNAWQTYYPRPQLRRESFLSLCDGGWMLDGLEIRVPFPPQSPQSGFDGPVGDVMRYEKRFALPAGFLPDGYRLIMHFGAVDYEAEVSINGVRVASHEGGYLPFSADVTDTLVPGENLLAVAVTDRLERDTPHGKQSKKRGGMWYTPVSGIWQSVWLEAVPEKAVRCVKIVPDLTGIDLLVDSDAPSCQVQVLFDGAEVAGATFALTGEMQRIGLPEEHRHLWTPDTPCLYDLVIRAGEDTVYSYFALRTVSIQPDGEGIQRVCLNGQPVFLNAVLDQGYFPEGIYLPGEPAEYERDILRMKALGFNMLRKHIKVEPECFYHACDRLGMLVMQDMVSGGPYSWLMDTALPTIGFRRTPHLPKTRLWKERFEVQARETVRHLHNHPCIVAYTIFNEGWGQFAPERMYHILRDEDPTRFYDVCSGWFAPKETDVDSLHVYFRNKRLHPRRRPMFLSECGGYARAIPGHLWKADADYGYGKTDTAEQLTAAIARMYREMVLPAIPEGLCGVVYTQLSDVEEEINGLYTYDRQVCKVAEAEMRRILKEAEDMME